MRNPYISLLKVTWHYARFERKKYIFIYILFTLSNLVFAIYPIIFGEFIDKIQKDNKNTLTYALYYSLIYIALKLLEWSFHGPARIMERNLAFSLSKNYLQEAYHQALHLPPEWHKEHHTGSIINRIRKAYEALKRFFEYGFIYFQTVSKFIFSFIAIFYYSPLFGLIGIIMGGITLSIMFKFDRLFVKTLREVNEKEHVISSAMFDSFSNIITVITLRLEKSMEKILISKVDDVYPHFRLNVIINEWKWFFASILIGVTYSIITFTYVYLNWQENQVFYIGGLITLLGYVSQFTSVFNDVGGQYTEILQFDTDFQTAKEINKSFSHYFKLDYEENISLDWKIIHVHNLNFSYYENTYTSPIISSLNNINLVIEKGKKIALVGKSGSGKSTLLSLLRGLYTTQQKLSVKIDDKQYDNLFILNKIVTLFPQEPEIFENTIEYNITLGLPFDKNEILKVTNIAHFTEVIEQFPNGLSSHIQEKGVNLSGGQKQRLALSRGIMAARDSQIILLDEPTSSIDPKTEVSIYENIFSAFSEKAIISSLHHLHLLHYFDYVYILEGGNIIEEGTYQYLQDNSSIFQDLWNHSDNHNNSFDHETD